MSTETEERNAVQIAGLRNGSGFHINSQSRRETVFDDIQFGTVRYEAVAGANQSAVNTTFQSGIVQRQGMLQQRDATFVHRGKSLHLTVFVTLAAPHVMVRQRFAHHHIRHLETGIDATRHTGTDNAIRSKTAYQLRGSHRRAYFADAALRKYQTVTAEHALRIAEIAVARHFLLLQTLRQLAVFAIHCADNTYRHAC